MGFKMFSESVQGFRWMKSRGETIYIDLLKIVITQK